MQEPSKILMKPNHAMKTVSQKMPYLVFICYPTETGCTTTEKSVTQNQNKNKCRSVCIFTNVYIYINIHTLRYARFVRQTHVRKIRKQMTCRKKFTASDLRTESFFSKQVGTMLEGSRFRTTGGLGLDNSRNASVVKPK